MTGLNWPLLLLIVLGAIALIVCVKFVGGLALNQYRRVRRLTDDQVEWRNEWDQKN